MPAFVRVEVLIPDPDLRVFFILDTGTRHAIYAGTENPDQPSPYPARYATEFVIEPDDDDPAGFDHANDMTERLSSVIRVMENAMNNHHIEGSFFDRELENVHLCKI